eukprot:CAMPEP_0184328768 /NCGR_PEP_ID=MMETSP1049-20130417/143582_1 /TAXON_ID=77928 /ORGANISM="Proteomonas sulcata, Strain CCMP704" /LENGTH=93 /DNA_ID=CAMNT_0026651097 /DNA_START=826 /DNA_END=1107 /DNA_ORIENTATION=+
MHPSNPDANLSFRYLTSDNGADVRLFGQPFGQSQMLSYKPPDWVWNRNYSWYGPEGVGAGEFDDNRAARGYDWYWEGPPSQVPNYSTWVANQP